MGAFLCIANNKAERDTLYTNLNQVFHCIMIPKPPEVLYDYAELIVVFLFSLSIHLLQEVAWLKTHKLLDPKPVLYSKLETTYLLFLTTRYHRLLVKGLCLVLIVSFLLFNIIILRHNLYRNKYFFLLFEWKNKDKSCP